MSAFEETYLPGIGTRYVVTTAAGDQLIIVVHDAGSRELYHATKESPATAIPIITLNDDEARLAAAIIGKTIHRPEAIERLTRLGVLVEWHRVAEGAYAIGKTLGEVLQDCGVAVIAIIDKEGKRQARPSPDFVLQESVQLALAGTQKQVRAAIELIEKGR